MFEFIIANFVSVVIFLIVLSILILVHEWGHFITAKKVGVRVDEFSLGFGPKLWSVKKGDTEYMVKAIPLGGYVKMAGDERGKCSGRPEEFFSKSAGLRSLVVVNGPMVNFVLAYVCLVFVFYLGYPALSTKIEYVDPGGPAARAGILVGDKITGINNQIVYGWHNMDERVMESRTENVAVTLVRNGRERTVSVVPQVIKKPDLLGVEHQARDLGIDDSSTVIGHVSENYPAYEAGLREGDRITRVNGRPVERWEDVRHLIADSSAESIEVLWIREGSEMGRRIIPKQVTFGKKIINQIGIAPRQNIDVFKVGFKDALVFSAEKLVEIISLTFRSLYHMIIGDISARETMTGPIGIFYLVKSAADTGFSQLLFIMGMISASLAIFNLLPIIPLDGGHLLLYGIEKFRGKPLSEKVEDVFMRLGVGLILLLAAYVFYSDFSRFGWIDGIMNIFVNHK